MCSKLIGLIMGQADQPKRRVTGQERSHAPATGKRNWSEWEDDQLRALVEERQQSDDMQWTDVAKRMRSERSGKQCRERWHNHLDPSIKKGPWSEEEDGILLEAQKEIGNKWSIISIERLPGRADNDIKNRWNKLKSNYSGANRKGKARGGRTPRESGAGEPAAPRPAPDPVQREVRQPPKMHKPRQAPRPPSRT